MPPVIGSWRQRRAARKRFARQSQAIASIRGADTKSGAAGVNLGALLRVPMVATSSSYTLVSGTSGHWNLPTNGTHPTPNSTGVAARLGGGPYVFAYTISDGSRTVTDTLTITRDLGRSLPAYTYISKNGGRVSVAAETFTTACYSVATTAEHAAVTAANRSGGTVLIAKGASGTIDLSQVSQSPTNPALVQSEDIANPTTVSRILVNGGARHRFDSLRVQMTKTAANTAFSNNANIIRTLGNCSDVRLSNITAGAPAGTAKNDYPGVSFQQATDLHVRNYYFTRYSSGDIRAQTRPVFLRGRHQYFNLDAFFLGNASNEVWTDGVFEDIIIGETHWVTGDQNHPDAAQIYTSAAAGQGIQLQGTMLWADVRSYGGAGDSSFNGIMYTGSGSGIPKLQGTLRLYGCAHSSLTTYAVGNFSNADYSASTATSMHGCLSVRQKTGVTGSNAGGKGSGAQGFDTWSDDGLTSIPTNNQRFAGHGQASWPANANMLIDNSYFDGVAPTLTGTMDISSSVYLGKTSSSVDPVGLTPAQINDESAGFDDPNRVVDWTGMTLDQIDAVYAQMYAVKAGGPRDNGDGTVMGRWCVRRNGAAAKPNQKGRATLSVSHSAGVATVTLSAALAVDVICDLYLNGSATGVAITIPAGSTSATGALAATTGDVLVAKNDSGLLNPSVTV